MTACVRAIGVICIVRNSSFLKRALSLRLFQFLGRMSYPVYLLHFPLIYSLISWLYLESPDFLRNQYALLLLIFIGLLLAASWVFYKTVEVPAVRMARMASASR